MAHYAAVISLRNTIVSLLRSCRISTLSTNREFLEFAYEEVKSSEEVLQTLYKQSRSRNRNDIERMEALGDEMREAACKLEDLLHLHVSQSVSTDDDFSLKRPISLDLPELRQHIDRFGETVAEMVEDSFKESRSCLPEEEEDAAGSSRTHFGLIIDLFRYIKNRLIAAASIFAMEEESSQEEEEEDDDDDDDDVAVPSRTVFSEQKPKMVGLSIVLNKVKDALSGRFKVIALTGMAGIGKTALAREVFEDPSISSRFEPRVWVAVGKNYEYAKITRDVLTELDPELSKRTGEGDERRALHQILKDQTWLIVLDDVWDNSVWRYLCDSLPLGNITRPRILITTRLHEVIYGISVISMPFLNKDQSWDLLRDKVFGEDSCHPQLERAGKKIAEKCDGLPLMIVKVVAILSKADKTVEYWDKVATDKRNSVFMDANDEVAKVLYPSYDNLSLQLKPCFLYLGVFPEYYEIIHSKLINLWIAEGFIQPDLMQTLKLKQALEELYFNSLVIVSQWASSWFVRFSTQCSHHQSCSSHCCGGKVWSVKARYIKSCRLQSSLWYMCNREGMKKQFFHVLDRYDADGLEQGIKSQRRVCIHNNILLGIKHLRDAIEDNCALTACSFLCYGPYHPYQVPICSGLRLLRVLDALTIRLYEFPDEVLKIVQLRYLALTYNGDLPSSISKLLNLQFLVINRHMSIKYCGALAYLPMEIWDMKEMKHLEIMGRNLPSPLCGANSLHKLSTLLGVNMHSLNEGVLERVPNLTKLGIRIELAPDDDGKSLTNCFDHVGHHLNKLESLKCVIVNPEMRSEQIVAPPPPALSKLPSTLKKLHLSGLGYSWEYMSVIGSLQNLKVLKLRCYALRGPKWEIEKTRFLRLRSLQIEDTDLVQLKVECGSLRLIEFLTIKHCYKLKQLNWESDNYPMDFRVVDCTALDGEHFDRIKTRARGLQGANLEENMETTLVRSFM